MTAHGCCGLSEPYYVAIDVDPLDIRTALTLDHDVASQTVVDEGTTARPQLTIAIPTFRRERLLREALGSALAQDADSVIEIIVIDNDPSATGTAAHSLSFDKQNRRVRYVVNDRNIGMFGNWNRAITMAQGEWFAILNDDDLFDPNFARRMLAELTAPDAPDALICCKRILDERPQTDHTPPATARAAKLILRHITFRGRKWRPITARHLFWGNVIGNSVGLMCRTRDLHTLGGFDPADFPSADYYLHARLATTRRLGQLSDVLASIRVAENESMKPETLYGFLRTGYHMQQALAARILPRWWSRLSPALIARHVGELSEGWRVPLDRMRVERELDIRLPRDPGTGIKLLRLLLGGW